MSLYSKIHSNYLFSLKIMQSGLLAKLWFSGAILSILSLFFTWYYPSPYYFSSVFLKIIIVSAVFINFRCYYLKKIDNSILRVAVFNKINEYLVIVLYLAYMTNRLAAISSGASMSLLQNYISFFITLLGSLSFLSHNLIRQRKFNKRLKERQEKRIRVADSLRKPHRYFLTLIEWVDALFQTAFYVIIINTLLFQLYIVPSESMVPTFLQGDRPLVLKADSHPTLPLSDLPLPSWRDTQRGDVIAFHNPIYNDDLYSQARSTLQQMLFYLTFTLVNIDKYDEKGNLKADPLVKRVIGLPGERLMMVDDQVYVQTDEKFSPLEPDKEYSNVDLFSLPLKERRHIDTTILISTERKILDNFDSLKKEKTLTEMEASIIQKYEKLQHLKEVVLGSISLENILNKHLLGRVRLAPNHKQLPPYSLLPNYRRYGELLVFLFYLQEENNIEAKKFFKEFSKTEPRSELFYQDARKTNLLFKTMILDLFLYDIQFIQQGGDLSEVSLESDYIELQDQLLSFISLYLNFYDKRNFPPLPLERDQRIPANHYFLMGDNRYNSLDLRYGEQNEQKPLDISDPYSIHIFTRLKPQYIEQSRFLGRVTWRLWPIRRFGRVK